MAGLFDLGSIIAGLGGAAKDIRAAITGDIPPEKKAELEAKAAELEAAVLQAQASINAEEAKSPNLFIAGWRPFVGWVCGIGVAVQFLIRPLAVWISAIFGLGWTLPELGLDQLIPLLVSMLGLSGYRTYEKKIGVADRH
jgi:hypothetical protein